MGIYITMHGSASTGLYSSRGERLGNLMTKRRLVMWAQGTNLGIHDWQLPAGVFQSLPRVLSAQMVATLVTQAPGLRGGLLFVTSHLAHGSVPLCRWQRAHAPGSTSAKKQLKCLNSPRGGGSLGWPLRSAFQAFIFRVTPPPRKTFSKTFHTF